MLSRRKRSPFTKALKNNWFNLRKNLFAIPSTLNSLGKLGIDMKRTSEKETSFMKKRNLL